MTHAGASPVTCPSGYPECFDLAALPWNWFRVMDPKLVEWAEGDLTRLNIDPRKRAQIEARYAAHQR